MGMCSWPIPGPWVWPGDGGPKPNSHGQTAETSTPWWEVDRHCQGRQHGGRGEAARTCAVKFRLEDIPPNPDCERGHEARAGGPCLSTHRVLVVEGGVLAAPANVPSLTLTPAIPQSDFIYTTAGWGPCADPHSAGPVTRRDHGGRVGTSTSVRCNFCVCSRSFPPCDSPSSQLRHRTFSSL